jgi:hypothetical protein
MYSGSTDVARKFLRRWKEINKCDMWHYNLLSLDCSNVFVSAPSARRDERTELCKLIKPVMEFCWCLLSIPFDNYSFGVQTIVLITILTFLVFVWVRRLKWPLQNSRKWDSCVKWNNEINIFLQTIQTT